MDLRSAEEGIEYIVQKIETDDEELDSFLFSLGCYAGEPITVVSHIKGGCVVSIKDGRYTIDNQLAEAIIIGTDSSDVKPSEVKKQPESKKPEEKKRGGLFGWLRK